MPARGFLLPLNLTNETQTVIEAYSRLVYVNETPFLSRVNRTPGKSESFNIISYEPRPRTATYVSGAAGSAPAAGTAETWTFSDTTGLQEGDILLAGTELVEVNAYLSATTVSVLRGAAGTTVIAGASVPTTSGGIKLRSNARFGKEVDQEGYRVARTAATQYHQRGLYAVQLGGRVLDIENQVTPGNQGIIQQTREDKLTDMVRDFEVAFFYGKAEAPSATVRAKTAGLQNLITSGNVKTNGGASYTVASLVADLFQKAFDGGGMIDVAFVSPGFVTGLHTWGFAKTQIYNLGTTKLGAKITGWTLPFHGQDVTFIPCPLLGSSTDHTIVGVTSSEISLSVLRPETWAPRGSRGDAYEADWLFDAAVRLINPNHHAWVSGITSFA